MLTHFDASVQFKDVKKTSECARFKLATHYCKFKTKLDAKGNAHMLSGFLKEREKRCSHVTASPSASSFASSAAAASQFFSQVLGRGKGPQPWGHL